MAKTFDKELFYKAGMFLKERDFTKAKEEYYKLLDNPEYRDKALITIAKIMVRENDFDKARKLLEMVKPDIDNSNYYETYAFLEYNDYNFDKSNMYFDKCIDLNARVEEIIFNKAINEMTKGNKNLAIAMLESLGLNESFNIRVQFELIILYLYYEEYDKAKKLIDKINLKTLTREDFIKYRILNTYILYHTNELKQCNISRPNIVSPYHYNILTSDNDDILLDHISKHFGYEYDPESYFYNTIDKIKLLKEVREKLQNINPCFHESSTTYHLNMGEDIGIKNGSPTRSICVVKAINTDRIITMYPIILSKSFDKEGYNLKKGVR